MFPLAKAKEVISTEECLGVCLISSLFYPCTFSLIGM